MKKNRKHVFALIIFAVLLTLGLTFRERKNQQQIPRDDPPIAAPTQSVQTPTQAPATPTRRPVTPTRSPVTPTPRSATPTPRPATPTPTPQVNLFEGYSIPQYRTRYTQLNATEQHIYRELRAAIIRDGNSCIISKVDYKAYADSIGRAIESLQLDFPEFFWISGGWQWQASYKGSIGDITITIKFREYWNDGSNKRQRIATVMSQAKAVANAAMQRPTHFERLRYIHDWICANITYDNEAYETRDQENRPPEHLQAYSAYGVFAKKTAVCQGYSMAYKLIANMCGYPCEYTRGTSQGESHGWNYVTINGNSYWIDVTWDDQDGKMNGSTCQYTYFMVSSKHLYRDHTVEGKYFSAPACNDDSMDYFSRYGSHFTQYDFPAINESVKKQMASGDPVQLRFENRELMDLAADYLFGDSKHWRQLEVGSCKSVSYYRNYDQLVISLRFNN